jgi:hypothetical protein
MNYGSSFLLGTKGDTYADGWRMKTNSVVDNGTVANAGNVSSDGPITNAISVLKFADDFGDSVGSKVVANDGTGASTTDRVGVGKAVSAGTLAFEANATQWIMKGGDVSTTIGGVSNNVLSSAGSDFNGVFATRDNVNQINSTRRLGSKSDEAFNMLTRPSTQIVPGRTKGTGAGNAQNYVQVDGSTAADDNAAAPTRSVPGELTYQFGGALPKLDVYKAKNVFES